MPGGLYPPPSVIASWPKPNYVDPVTRGDALTYVCIILSALSLAIVTARIYSRIFITKAPGADDVLVVVAAAFGIALSVLLVIQEKTFYIGRHIWDIPITKFSGQRKNVFICEICYLVATCSVKISILLFYRRLSVTFSKPFLIATWVGILYNVLYFLGFTIGLLALFHPLNAYWLSFDPVWAATHSYSHGNEQISLPISAALSVVGDFYSTVLPLLLIRFLDLPQRQKAALYSLFALGFLVVAAGIVRTLLLNRVVSQTYDNSWVLWENWIWTVVELNVAILAASAPALKPFFRRFLIDPIVSSGKNASYMNESRRRSSAGRVRGPQRFGWSNNSSTARDSITHNDVEKTGIAMTEPQSKGEMIEEEIDDGLATRRYQLRTSRDGKLVPVQVQVHEQSGFDTRSANSTDFILASNKAGDMDASTGSRQYRVQIESLPPVPYQQQHQLQNLNQSNALPRAPARTPSQSSMSRHGSVRAMRPRIQQPQYLDEPDHHHSRSISRGSDRNFSLPSTAVGGNSPYQHFGAIEDDAYGNDRSSSEETLDLPRQGSRNGTRESGVGYAV